MNNLLPCPFCGVALTGIQTADDGSNDIVWAEHADKRGCILDGDEFDWSKEGEWRKWNTRALEQQAERGVGAMVPEGAKLKEIYEHRNKDGVWCALLHSTKGAVLGTGPTIEAAITDAVSGIGEKKK